MKNIIILSFSILLILIGCNNNQKKENIETKVKSIEISENFDWILGEWIRNNEKKGKNTYEIWKKNSTSEYTGFGYTIKENDTVRQEFIKLYYKDEKWLLQVDLLGSPDIVTFKMTSIANSGFICENQNNDFPKLIKYWKNGNKLNALVSGDDFQIPFEFEKITKK